MMAVMASPRALPPEPEPVDAPLLRVFVTGKPISSNDMYGARGSGAARRLTPEARSWRDAVAASVLAWRFPASAPRPILAVDCVFVGARADIDNLCKLVLDGVKTGLAVDDRFILRLVVEKQPLPRGGQRGAWIAVSVLPTPEKPPRLRRTRKKAM